MGTFTDIVNLRFTASTTPAQKELGKLEQSTYQLKEVNKGLRLEMEKLKAQGKKDTKEFANLKAQFDKNKTTISQNEVKMSELRKEMGLTSMTAHQLRSRVNNLKRQLNGMSKAANPKLWNQLNDELKDTQRQIDRVKAGGKNTSGVFGKLNKMVGGLLPAFGFAAISAGVLKIGKELFNLSKQITGENLRANIVLGDSLGYVEHQAELLSEKMGVTNHQFKSMVTSTADLLVPLDFSRKKSAEMSVELQKLTGALDEWTAGSIGAKGVSEILTKAMLGENEQLKQLGIAIRKDSEEFRELVKQKKAAGNVTTAQAEALATLELIQKKSADAQTAYMAEGNKLLRMQKSVTRWWQNMKESVVGYFEEIKPSKQDNLRLLQQELKSDIAVLNKANFSTKQRKKYISELNDKYGDYLPRLITEKDNYTSLLSIQKKVNSELELRIMYMMYEKEIKKITELKVAALNSQYEVEKKISKNKAKSMELTYGKDALKAETKQLEGFKRLNDTFINSYDQQKQAIEDKYDSIAKKFGSTLNDLRTKLRSGNDDDTDSGDKTSTQLEAEKKLQDDILKYQQSITSAKIALMKDGIDKEKALENAKWDKRKTELQKQIVEKEKISELELEKNKQIKSLIESEHEVHLKKLAEMDKAEAQRKKTEKDLEAVEALENEIRNATNDEERWNARIQLADLRKSIELEKAKKHKGKIIAIESTHAKEIKKIEKEKLDKKIKAFDQEKQIMAAKADVARGFLDLTTEIFGKESALGKAAFVLKQAMAIGEVWFNTMIANSKAVAASWITGGQPWVGINTTQAVASTALITAQTIKGLEDGDYWSVQREQDKQWFDAQFKPRKRGYINKPTVLVGENNKRELVVSNKGVENKTLRPFLDIINDSQKNGTIETLDFFNVAKNVTMKGREQGGYEFDSSSSGSNKIDYEESTSDDRADAEMLAVLGKMTDTLNKLIDDGVSIDPYKMARTFSDISINKSLNSM